MKKLITVFSILLLASCAHEAPSEVLTKTELQVVIPDRSLFYCQNVRNFPGADKLTDIQVAKLLVELHQKNTECQKNINAVYKFLQDAEKKTKD